MKRSISWGVFAATALVLSGCGASAVTNPNTDGQVRGMIADNPNGVSPQVTGASFSVTNADGASAYSGTISGDVALAISANDTTWVELGAPRTVSIEASNSASNGTDVTGSVTVSAGSYTRVRLTMSNVVLHLNAGSVISGVTLSSDVALQVGTQGQDVVVDVAVPAFQVTAGDTTETDVVVNLNSQAWVNTATVTAQAVTAAELQAAVQAAAAVKAS